MRDYLPFVPKCGPSYKPLTSCCCVHHKLSQAFRMQYQYKLLKQIAQLNLHLIFDPKVVVGLIEGAMD